MSKFKDVRACPQLVVQNFEEANLAIEQKLHEPFTKSVELAPELKNDEWGLDDSDEDFGVSADISGSLLKNMNPFNLISDEDVVKKKNQSTKKWGQVKLTGDEPTKEVAPEVPEPQSDVKESPSKPKLYVPKGLKSIHREKRQIQVDIKNTEEFESLDNLSNIAPVKTKFTSSKNKSKKAPKEKQAEKPAVEAVQNPPQQDKTLSIEKFLQNISVQLSNVSLDPEKAAAKYHNRPRKVVS